MTVTAARLRAAPLLAGITGLAGAALVAVLVGPVRLAPGAVLAELAGRLPGVHIRSGLTRQEAAILWELRLPRVVLGGLVGAMLAMAGAAYQGVFRNPLADPYLLGAAAGAGLGATLAIAYGPDTSGWPVDLLPLAAFAGAVGGVAAAYALGRSGGARTATTLILSGVAVAAFLTAVQTYVQQRQSETLREVYGWILGRLTTAGWREVALVLPYALVSAVAIVAHRRLLDVLAVGDDEATSLGLNAAQVRLVVVGAATLATAAAVAVSGLIGFVGIIVPHTVRLLAGTSYRRLLPLSLVGGAAFLILADLVARTVTAPAELPIGVVTAFFGAPFFALVLRTARRAP
ncbi:MAG TPA: iron ABC transporter permease [Actinomycetes bacterium]|nr:iron ABC transporter permease [Actinomycetes bacterium]